MKLTYLHGGHGNLTYFKGGSREADLLQRGSCCKSMLPDDDKIINGINLEFGMKGIFDHYYNYDNIPVINL